MIEDFISNICINFKNGSNIDRKDIVSNLISGYKEIIVDKYETDKVKVSKKILKLMAEEGDEEAKNILLNSMAFKDNNKGYVYQFYYISNENKCLINLIKKSYDIIQSKGYTFDNIYNNGGNNLYVFRVPVNDYLWKITRHIKFDSVKDIKNNYTTVSYIKHLAEMISYDSNDKIITISISYYSYTKKSFYFLLNKIIFPRKTFNINIENIYLTKFKYIYDDKTLEINIKFEDDKTAHIFFIENIQKLLCLKFKQCKHRGKLPKELDLIELEQYKI